MRKFAAIVCGGFIVLGLWRNPALAQKKSVAEEILDILKADNKISDQQYQELMSKAKAENEAREAGVEAFRRDPVKDVRKAISWLDRFTFSGDLRVRNEDFFQANGPNAEARVRQRFRLRFGATMKLSDEVLAGLRLASGTANDPISTNQTMTDLFTRKPISIDQAYITLTPKQSIGLGDYPGTPISITGGKFANTAFKPRAVMVSEMMWDDDLTPEGFTQTFTLFEAPEGVLRRFQVIAQEWTARENSRAADAWIWGGQTVATTKPLSTLGLIVSLGAFGTSKSDSIAQARNSNSELKLTNSVVLRDGTIVKGGFPISPGAGNKQIQSFYGSFTILNGGFQLEYDTGYAKWPLGIFADFAHNFDAKTNEKFAVWTGLSLGATKNPGDWAFSAVWGHVETDSVMSFFSYSDFGRDGGTNVQGPFIKVDYMLFPRLVLTAKNHFVSFIDRPAGQSQSTVYRLQLDAQVSF
jgi:hypothetical protein